MIKFTADLFTPTAYVTAQEKADFANHFVRFVCSDCKWTLFHKSFYNRLSMTFGNIAHFNRGEFWRTCFEDNAAKYRFFVRITNCYCVGDPAFTFSDVERELIKWLLDEKCIQRVAAVYQKDIDTQDRAEYERLKLKFDIVAQKKLKLDIVAPIE